MFIAMIDPELTRITVSLSLEEKETGYKPVFEKPSSLMTKS